MKITVTTKKTKKKTTNKTTPPPPLPLKKKKVTTRRKKTKRIRGEKFFKKREKEFESQKQRNQKCGKYTKYKIEKKLNEIMIKNNNNE